MRTPIDCLGLIGLLERLAAEEYDGHLTIMRFTTGWKVMLGTPMLDAMGHVEVGGLDSHATLSDALRERLARPNELCAVEDLEAATSGNVFTEKHLDRSERRSLELRRTITGGMRAGMLQKFMDDQKGAS